MSNSDLNPYESANSGSYSGQDLEPDLVSSESENVTSGHVWNNVAQMVIPNSYSDGRDSGQSEDSFDMADCSWPQLDINRNPEYTRRRRRHLNTSTMGSSHFEGTSYAASGASSSSHPPSSMQPRSHQVLQGKAKVEDSSDNADLSSQLDINPYAGVDDSSDDQNLSCPLDINRNTSHTGRDCLNTSTVENSRPESTSSAWKGKGIDDSSDKANSHTGQDYLNTSTMRSSLLEGSAVDTGSSLLPSGTLRSSEPSPSHCSFSNHEIASANILADGHESHQVPQPRENSIDKAKFNNVCVKNLSESVTSEDLRSTFREFGTITGAFVVKDAEGRSKGFGFVHFEKSDDAAIVVEALNGKKIDDKEWYVERARKEGTNLYIKNLDRGIDEKKLEDLFYPLGSIVSCKVVRDDNGLSKGSGFVAFTTVEVASHALKEMNGKEIDGRRLDVSFAESKEDRTARQQKKHLLPTPRGQGQRAASTHSVQQPTQEMQQPLLPRGPFQGRMYDIGAFNPQSRDAFVRQLVDAPLEEQRQLLEDNLYPLVEQLEPERAGKVIEMLLQMDSAEVLHLLESPDDLKAKVAEAMEVLRNAAL